MTHADIVYVHFHMLVADFELPLFCNNYPYYLILYKMMHTKKYKGITRNKTDTFIQNKEARRKKTTRFAYFYL